MNHLLIFVLITAKVLEVTTKPAEEDEMDESSDTPGAVEHSAISEEAKLSVDAKVNNGTRYILYREMDGGGAGGASRRVYGGAAKQLAEFPAACALLDRYWAVRCSGTALAARWVLTAAHCVSPKVSYVKYNTRRPASNEGNVTPVHYLYRHPNFKVEQKDEGHGMDVVTLLHDVGLIRTKYIIELAAPGPVLTSLRRNNPVDLYNKDVQVLGFGRTERSVLGEELFGVALRLVACERAGWRHCVCGVSPAAAPRAVCSGDSGGPVLYEGAPVGVTSMGPVECAHSSPAPPAGATSVFTALYQYADVINQTIADTEAALRLRNRSPHTLVVSQSAHLPNNTASVRDAGGGCGAGGCGAGGRGGGARAISLARWRYKGHKVYNI